MAAERQRRERRRGREIGDRGSGRNGPQQRSGMCAFLTDMQASEGVSLEAQQGAIRQYCELHGLRLLAIHQDVLSGGKSQQPGLADALSRIRRDADVLLSSSSTGCPAPFVTSADL